MMYWLRLTVMAVIFLPVMLIAVRLGWDAWKGGEPKEEVSMFVGMFTSAAVCLGAAVADVPLPR